MPGSTCPANVQIFGKLDPNVRKPTAIVNGTVITGTDVDQRVGADRCAPTAASCSAEERDRLRLQVLRSLIDETLEIQEAKANEITITPEEIDQSFARVARNFKQTPDRVARLSAPGSARPSARSSARSRANSPGAACCAARSSRSSTSATRRSTAILDRLKAAKGTRGISRLSEIYLSATPGSRAAGLRQHAADDRADRAGRQPFEYYAPIFRSLDARGRRRSRLGARRRMLPDALAQAAQTDAGRPDRRADRGAGRLLDPLSRRQAPGADGRSARRACSASSS